jgi:hypothetical protein
MIGLRNWRRSVQGQEVAFHDFVSESDKARGFD